MDIKEDFSALIRAEERELNKRRELFEPLVHNPAFQELQRLAAAAVQHRVSAVLQPATDIMYGVKSEFEKGAIFGISWIMNLPADTLALAKDINLAARKDEQNASGTDRFDGRPASSRERNELGLPEHARVTADDNLDGD